MLKDLCLYFGKCEICVHSSSQKNQMNRRIVSVHEGKKPFKCDICDYRCSRKSALNQHVASVHKGNKPCQ